MSERQLVTLALFVATFLVSLDAAVVSTAMPTVIGQIGGIGLYAWVFSAYLLTSTVSVPIYGKLADLYGRKPVFLAATGIFLVGSMLCGQAQTMEQLIVFRLLQGLGAGGVLPITQTILGDVFPLAERARMTGYFSTVWGVSGLLGPAIGGFLTERASWRWVFYVNFPLCVLSMILISTFLHERVTRRRHTIDYLGALSLSAAVALLLFALQAPATGSIVPAWALYVAALGLAIAFVWQERRAPEPLVPLKLFGIRVIGIGTLVGLMIGVMLFGQSAFVPPFVQGVMGATPTLSGFVLAGSSIGWPIASTISGRLLLRLGFRIPCVLGGALLTIGFALLRVLPADANLLVPAAIEVVIGAGFGFATAVIIVAAQAAVGWEQRGVVTSANQFARSIGGTVGVSLAGALFASGVAAAAGAGINPNDLLSPQSRAGLAAADLGLLQGVLSGSLRSVYLLFTAIGGLAMLLAALLPGGRPEAAAVQAQRGAELKREQEVVVARR